MDTNKLEDTANQLLITLIDKATQGADFIQGQVPDLIQQLLRWTAAEDIFWIMMCFVVWTATYVGSKRAIKTDDGDIMMPVFIIGSIASFLSVAVFFTNTMDLIKVTIAPKLWLLEYGAHLLKGR